MSKLRGEVLTLPKMSGSVSTPNSLSGNVGAKTINIGGKGDDGATFVPSVSADGIISWTNDKDLPNPEPVNIKGVKGDKGDRGLQGVQGIQGERGEQGQKGDKGDRGEQGIQGVQGVKGETGATGAKGADGTPATHRWSGTTLYITSASGTSSANLKGDKGDKGDTGATGANGTNGKDGEAGVSPVVSVEEIDGGHRVTITDAKGAKAFDVMDGKGGSGGGGNSDSVENVKLSASCVFAESYWAEMVSHETFTLDTLKNFAVIEKCAVRSGNYYGSRSLVGLYKDANNYLKLSVSGYSIVLENNVAGTKTTKTYSGLVNNISKASDVCSKLDLIRKKVEMHGLVSGEITTFIDEDIGSFDLSALDTFHLVTGAGKFSGHQFNIYARINDYFNYAELMKQHLYMSEYNSLPVMDGEKTVYAPTSVVLDGTIISTISATHKISNVAMSSDNYLAMQSATTAFNGLGVYLVTRFKVTNMSEDTSFGLGAGVGRGSIVDENGVCVWNSANARFTPEEDKWYYLATEVKDRSLSYCSTFGMKAIGTFTIEAEALFITAPRSINMCAETWNGQYFTGALPFKGTGVNFVAVNSFTGSGNFVPILATNITAGKINMYNGNNWVVIG